MKVEKKQNDILPEVITENNTKVAYGLDGSPSSGGAVILVDENKRFYYSTFNSGRGKFQVPEIAQELNETYQVDLIAKSQRVATCVSGMMKETSFFISIWAEEVKLRFSRRI